MPPNPDPLGSGDPDGDRRRILRELATPGGLGGRGFKGVDWGEYDTLEGPSDPRPQRPSSTPFKPTSGGFKPSSGGSRPRASGHRRPSIDIDIGGGEFNPFDAASVNQWVDGLVGDIERAVGSAVGHSNHGHSGCDCDW
jgi:hypothetical protein